MCKMCGASGARALMRFYCRLRDEQKKLLWPLYGRFTLSAFVSCCFGIFLVSVRIFQFENALKLLDATDRVAAMNLSSQRPSTPQDLEALARYSDSVAEDTYWQSLITIQEGCELIAISWAKLAVLERITHSAVSSARGVPRRWVVAKWTSMAIITSLLLTALCSRVAVRVMYHQFRAYHISASSEFRSNNRDGAVQLISDASASSIQKATGIFNICDAVCLCYIVVAFLLVAGFCAGRIKRIVQLPSSTSGTINRNQNGEMKAVMWRVIATCAVVFVSLLLMAIVTTTYAVSMFEKQNGEDCQHFASISDVCDPCHDEPVLVLHWTYFNPEFLILGYYLSSPIALLVALWGMTSTRLLRALRQSLQKRPDEACQERKTETLQTVRFSTDINDAVQMIEQMDNA